MVLLLLRTLLTVVAFFPGTATCLRSKRSILCCWQVPLAGQGWKIKILNLRNPTFHCRRPVRMIFVMNSIFVIQAHLLNDRGPISKSFEESALRHHADSACRVYTLTPNRKSLDTRAGQSSLKGSAYCRGEGKSDISSKTLSNMYLWVTECFFA